MLADALAFKTFIHFSVIDIDLIPAWMKILKLGDALASLLNKERTLLPFDVIYLHLDRLKLGGPGCKCCRLSGFELISCYMKTGFLALALMCTAGLLTVDAQSDIRVNDPLQRPADTKIGRAEEAIFRREALPAVRKQLQSSSCKEDVDIVGAISGSFLRPDSLQSIIFYQFCKTGNGLGWVGLVVLDHGAATGNFISNSGWASAIAKLPDIDGNGLEEFSLAYNTGFGAKNSGIGIDLMQFVGDRPVGTGWFKSEEYADFSSDVWMLTVKPGKMPSYLRQK